MASEQMFLNTRQETDIKKNAQTIVDIVNRHNIIGPEYTLGVEVFIQLFTRRCCTTPSYICKRFLLYRFI